ncbi:MAG TPA: hypothetical protein ENN60_00450 [archaeon]|nr:hypothetical protein [archaeon]
MASNAGMASNATMRPVKGGWEIYLDTGLSFSLNGKGFNSIGEGKHPVFEVAEAFQYKKGVEGAEMPEGWEFRWNKLVPTNPEKEVPANAAVRYAGMDRYQFQKRTFINKETPKNLGEIGEEPKKELIKTLNSYVDARATGKSFKKAFENKETSYVKLAQKMEGILVKFGDQIVDVLPLESLVKYSDVKGLKGTFEKKDLEKIHKEHYAEEASKQGGIVTYVFPQLVQLNGKIQLLSVDERKFRKIYGEKATELLDYTAGGGTLSHNITLDTNGSIR